MKIKVSNEAVDFATLELLPLGVIVVNDQGTILFYNNREEEISGRRREDVLGANFFLEVAPCAAVREFHGRFRQIMDEGGEEVEFDFAFPFTSGLRQVRINLHPFLKDGEWLCIIFVADLTERELLREKILQNQRFAELGEVAAKVAHNFNNLLFVIQASAQMAWDCGSPEVQRHLDRVEGAVQDGATLVNRCRAIARSGFTATADRVDLNASVATVVDYARQYADTCLKADGPQVDVRFNPAPGDLAVLGDGGELREALLNLVRNAIEAIPERGTVRILTSREDGVAVVDILDDGSGMTPEIQRHLFTPMFTTKGERGTGLGLASAHSTISRHQGAIEVESWPGKGTRFRIALPLAATAP